MIEKEIKSRPFLNAGYEILTCLFLIVAILMVYLQVGNHDFINFDDDKYVYANQHVQKGLTLESISWAFTSTHASNWHPFTWISHMLDVSLYGMNPGRHHLTNVFFHIINSLLLFIVFRNMTKDLWKSAFIAALFALHPLHVESVAWVAERKDVLSTFFWILTMWCYAGYIEEPGVKRYSLVLLFFIFGLMSKPMLVTLPFVLLLLDYWPLGRLGHSVNELRSERTKHGIRIKGLVLEKIPFFILAAAASGITFLAQKSSGAVASIEANPFDIRVANVLVSYVSYMCKMLWPFKLAVLYPYPSSLPLFKAIGAGLIILTLSILVIRLRKCYSYVTIGWLWYIGTLIPVIGLVQVGSQAMADRYTYVPLIGIFIIITWGVPELLSGKRFGRSLQSVAATVIILLLMVSTFMQVRYWKNSTTLFTHTINVTSDNHLAHTNLGLALPRPSKISDAIEHYFNALRINPNDYKAHLNLGNDLASQGKIDSAIEHYFKALNIHPEYASAHHNLGIALARKGNVDEAINHYYKALQIDPKFLAVHVTLGFTLTGQGSIDEAIRHYFEALRIDPDLAIVHFNLGVELVKQRRFTEAVYHYSESLRLNPDDAEAHNNLGTALIKMGKIEKAIVHFQEALGIKPDYAIAQHNLKNTLEAKRNVLIQDVSNTKKK